MSSNLPLGRVVQSYSVTNIFNSCGTEKKLDNRTNTGELLSGLCLYT